MILRFPWRLFTRIVLFQAVLLLIALGTTGLAARYFFKRQFLSQMETQLRMTLEAMVRPVSHDRKGMFQAIDLCESYRSNPDFKLALITPVGGVQCDSHDDLKSPVTHDPLELPEVVQASKAGYGSSFHVGADGTVDAINGALFLRLPFSDHPSFGYYFRGQIPLTRLLRDLKLFDYALAAFLALVAIAVTGFATWSGRRLAFPLGRILMKARTPGSLSGSEDLKDSAKDDTFGELSELEISVDEIKRDLEAKAESLSREREEHQTLMSAISDAILAVDLEGAPLFFNSRFLLQFGHKDLGRSKTRLWEMFRDPEILGAFRAAFKDSRTAHVNVPLETEGARRFFSLSVAPLRRGSGEVYGAVGVFHDVTELKRAEQIRIDFVANVSHELRTPLTAIKGYADTIEQDVSTGRPVAKEFVEIISRNTARLMSLINDLLDLSSLESHADDLQKADVSTEEITGRILKQLEGTAKARNQSLQLRTDSPIVYADPRRLEQVLVNLIDNAIKYTPVGSTVSVLWEKDPGGGTILKVRDTGPGIPPEHHERLFERFYRIDKARSRELGGTGLGLAIVKHIMQRHAGSVSIESSVGHGATFVCRFPGRLHP